MTDEQLNRFDTQVREIVDGLDKKYKGDIDVMVNAFQKDIAADVYSDMFLPETTADGDNSDSSTNPLTGETTTQTTTNQSSFSSNTKTLIKPPAGGTKRTQRRELTPEEKKAKEAAGQANQNTAQLLRNRVEESVMYINTPFTNETEHDNWVSVNRIKAGRVIELKLLKYAFQAAASSPLTYINNNTTDSLLIKEAGAISKVMTKL